MFTGLVETTAEILNIREGVPNIRLEIRTTLPRGSFQLGDSIAVNGCCLTLVRQLHRRGATVLAFDLLAETWRLTNFQDLKPGQWVNLERSLRGDSRLGGHFVTGHVDGLGKIVRWEPVGVDHRLEIQAPKNILACVVNKGSIAVDGISLTVADLRKDRIGIWIIPHTFEATQLKDRKVGDRVNLETDMLGKYVVQFLKQLPARRRK